MPERDDDNHPERSDEPVPEPRRDAPRPDDAEWLYLTTSDASEARASSLLPGVGSEDVSHLLVPPDTSDAPPVSEDSVEPEPVTDWVIRLDFPDEVSVSTHQVESVFSTGWRDRYDRPKLYGCDLDTGRWSDLHASDAPERVTALQLAWHFVNPLAEPEPTPANEFQRRIDAVREAATHFLVPPAVHPLMPCDKAAARTREIVSLVRTYDRSAILILQAPDGEQFDGRAIWDVMLCLGLRWGDMDCFHWEAYDDPVGSDFRFTVESASPPGYFLPETIAAGELQTAGLVFVYRIPRCWKPVSVFHSMVRAIEYAKERLGGVIIDSDGNDADIDGIEKMIAETAERFTEAGFPPGTRPALRAF